MTLQEKLDALKADGTPIPLVGVQAIQQALRLRRAGLTYGTIATVMRVYHGSSKPGESWRNTLRTYGAEPKHHANGSRRVPPQVRDAGR